MQPLEWVRENERCVLGSVRNLGLLAWRNAPEVDDIRYLRSYARTLGQTYSGKAGCIDIAFTGTPRFSEDLRTEVHGLATDPKVFPLGTAHVVMLGGLAGAAVRAFIATVTLVSRPPAPAKVFANLEEAGAWLLPKFGVNDAWTPHEIRIACEALVKKLAQPRALSDR